MSGTAALSMPRRDSGTVLAACLFVAAVASSWHSALAAPGGTRNIGIEGLFGGRMLAPGQVSDSLLILNCTEG